MASIASSHNADQVARGLHLAAGDLADLEATNAQAGRVVLAATRPPRVTNALAEGLFAQPDPGGVLIASRVGYWSYVHWGAPGRNVKAQPFILLARRATEDQVVGLYADHARTAITANL